MRDVKMRLIESTMSLLVVDEAKQEDGSAVEQWLLMLQKTVTVVNVSGSKRKHGDNGQSNETPTNTQPSTPSLKMPTQNYTTMITLTSNMVQSPDECCSLSEEILVLASFNPRLLQSERRVVNGVDLDSQLFHGMINELVRLCTTLNEPLQFQYQNEYQVDQATNVKEQQGYGHSQYKQMYQ